MAYGHWGEFLVDIKMHLFGIRRTVLGPAVCLCIRIGAMMHLVHTGEAMVTSQKIDIFLLVNTRLIVHSGQCEFLPNCIGEFGMDTGQP